jgi:hypothetical protein
MGVRGVQRVTKRERVRERPQGHVLRHCLTCGQDAFPNYFYCPRHHNEMHGRMDEELAMAGQGETGGGNQWRSGGIRGRNPAEPLPRQRLEGGEMSVASYAGMRSGTRG